MHCIELIEILVRQGLAVRGNNDESDNLMQLLKCCSGNVKGLKSWISKRLYFIIDEQIKIVAVCMLDKILVRYQCTGNGNSSRCSKTILTTKTTHCM